MHLSETQRMPEVIARFCKKPIPNISLRNHD